MIYEVLAWRTVESSDTRSTAFYDEESFVRQAIEDRGYTVLAQQTEMHPKVHRFRATSVGVAKRGGETVEFYAVVNRFGDVLMDILDTVADPFLGLV